MSFADIKQAVATYYRVPFVMMDGPSRRKPYVRARQVAMYIAHHEGKYSSNQIGRWLGNRDHTTVLHGIDRIEFLLAGDPSLAADVSSLRDRLFEGGVAA